MSDAGPPPTRDTADPQHAAQVVELARRAPAAPRPVVIAIDGAAGSGKSSLAALVSERLAEAPVVHMDDLFPGWDGLSASSALLTAQVLVPAHRGEPISYRRFDWESGAYAELVAVPSSEVLVVEGCGSSVGIARPYVDVRVWLDADRDERMRRGIARDGDMFAPHWDRWAEQEKALYAQDRTPSHAHLRLRTG